MNRRHFIAALAGVLVAPFVVSTKKLTDDLSFRYVLLTQEVSLVDYQRQFNRLQSETMERVRFRADAFDLAMKGLY